ncbi:hypothetical protein [Microbacterium gorillae]|uniref:hypothetical protein n=1 Tax=Microbacterium gorillae TaxID=1231063 RepID=UPI00058EC644|nr:hypothetical protein [Microbacterium gorillae]
MVIRLTDTGIADTLAGDIPWLEVAAVTATTVDHMTQRVPTITFTGLDGTEIETAEGASGWDDLVTGLADRLPVTVPDLGTALALLRTGEVLTLYAHG